MNVNQCRTRDPSSIQQTSFHRSRSKAKHCDVFTGSEISGFILLSLELTLQFGKKTSFIYLTLLGPVCRRLTFYNQLPPNNFRVAFCKSKFFNKTSSPIQRSVNLTFMGNQDCRQYRAEMHTLNFSFQSLSGL